MPTVCAELPTRVLYPKHPARQRAPHVVALRNGRTKNSTRFSAPAGSGADRLVRVSETLRSAWKISAYADVVHEHAAYGPGCYRIVRSRGNDCCR